MARYSAERLSAAVLLTGSAMLIPVSLPQLADTGLGRAAAATPGSRSATASCFSLLVTNVLWFDAIHRVGAARATVFLYLEPFCVALIAMAVLSEYVSRGRVGRRRRHPRRRPGRGPRPREEREGCA